MPECVICGESFTSPYVVAVICSPECKKERRRQYSRDSYGRRLEREGKQRTKGRLRCSVDGCAGKYYAKGICNMHYAREWRKANPGRRSRRHHDVVLDQGDMGI